MMKVRNMRSSRTNREVANQFILEGDNKVVFQSYQSIICVIDYDKQGADRITLGHDWDYSKTTSKYLYQFLNDFAGMDANRKSLTAAIANRDIAYDECLF